MKRRVIIALGTLCAGYLALTMLAFAFQRTLLFPVPAGAKKPQRCTLVELPETVLMHCLPEADHAPVVVHFHGNGEQLADGEWLALRYAEAGVGFIEVEYPGYGLARAKGPLGEAAMVKAAEAAMAHVHGTLGVAKERIVLSGQSLGSGVAVQMAAKGHGARLVLVTPYTTLPDVGARHFPFLPVRLLMRDRFDSASLAPSLELPVVIVHGTADEVVPYDLGAALSKKFPRARLVTIDGARHNDVVDRPAVWDVLIPFALVGR